MGAQNIIELGFDPKIESEKTQIVTGLKELLAVAKELSSYKISFGDVDNGLSAFKKSSDALLKTQSELTSQTEKYNKALILQGKAAEAAAKARLAESKAENEQLKTQKQKNAETEKATKLSATERRQIEQATNEYFQLNKALKDAEDRYKNLALTVGFENDATKEALKTALSYRAVLDKVDQSLNNYQRNVGNYASAYNGLGNSIQQVLREAPSAAVSLNTFFLAISNNLPILFDEISKLKKEQELVNLATKEAALLEKEQAVATALQAGATEAAAIAEGELAAETVVANAAATAAPGILKRVLSSLFSLNTLLTLSVLAFTLFGSEAVAAVGNLVKHKNAVDDAVDSQEILNRINEKAIESYGAERANLEILTAQLGDENLSRKAKQDLIKEAQTQFPGYFDNLTLEGKTVKGLAEAYQNAAIGILAKAKAEAAAGLVGENETKILQAQLEAQQRISTLQDYDKKNPGGIGPGSAKAGVKEIEARTKLTVDALEKENQFLISQIIDNNKKIDKAVGSVTGDGSTDKGDKTTNKQLSALLELQRLKIQAEADAQKKIADDQSKGLVERLTALKKYYELQAEFINRSADDEIKVNKLTGNEVLLEREKALQSIQKLNESVGTQAEQINREAIAKAQAEIRKAYGDDKKQKEADNAVRLAEEQALQDKIIAIGDETYNKSKKRREQEEKDEKESDEKKLERKKLLTAAEEQLAKEILSLTESLVTIGYEKELNALQAVQDASNERYSNEIKNVQNSTLSEQEKADKITVLQAEQEANQKRLDKQKRDIQVKEARVAKIAQAASIVATTAEAVIAALAPPPVGLGPVAGVPLAVITGAIGAVQLAKVLATPIPQYAEGTDNHPGGLALVGEGKHKELVNMPGHDSFITDGPQLLNMPAGSSVLPLTGDYLNESMNRAMMQGTNRLLQMGNYVENLKERQNKDIMGWHADKIIKALGKKSPTNVRVNITDNADFKIWVDKNVRGKG